MTTLQHFFSNSVNRLIANLHIGCEEAKHSKIIVYFRNELTTRAQKRLNYYISDKSITLNYIITSHP